MNPTILGVIGPGFLNQVPTLGGGNSPAAALEATLRVRPPTAELTTTLNPKAVHPTPENLHPKPYNVYNLSKPCPQNLALKLRRASVDTGMGTTQPSRIGLPTVKYGQKVGALRSSILPYSSKP